MLQILSVFYKTYMKGSDMANYLIDLKLFEMAQSGDIKAIDKLSERKKICFMLKKISDSLFVK